MKRIAICLLVVSVILCLSCATPARKLQAQGFSEHEIQLIRSRTLEVGMTRTAVKAMFHSPDRTSTSFSGSNLLEMWVYKPWNVWAKTEDRTYFLFFENGILTSWTI